MATITDTHKINPTDLLVDLNVRQDLHIDKTLIDSIRDHGVLQPIIAVRTDEGPRVRFGHRRTSALTAFPGAASQGAGRRAAVALRRGGATAILRGRAGAVGQGRRVRHSSARIA